MENTARSLEKKLNELIDNEIDKDVNADTQLILACCDALLRLDDVSRYTMSAQVYQEKLNRITGFSDRARPRRKTVKALLIAAVIAALLSVAALGYAQVKYDIFHFKDHSTVSAGFHNNERVNDVTVGYVPAGFALSFESRKKHSVSLEYKRSESYFSIVKGSVQEKTNIDTEFDDSKTITINGIEYILYGENSYGWGVLWVSDEYSYSLFGNLGKDEIIKIATSVR